MIETLAEDIHRLFLLKEYQWKIDGTLCYPEVQDIQDTLDRVRDRLYAEEVGSQLEVGRLIGKRTNSGVDIYLLMGEHNYDTDKAEGGVHVPPQG